LTVQDSNYGSEYVNAGSFGKYSNSRSFTNQNYGLVKKKEKAIPVTGSEVP
jgi:hypothetical protein